MLKPPPREKIEFERVNEENWVTGIIFEVQHDPEHKTTYKGEEKIRDCVRFKFQLDGYEHYHYSRWMTFSYDERSNLYNKYLCSLIEGAQPDMDFDLEELNGMRIKTMWTTKNDFQSIELIRPELGKRTPQNLNTGQLNQMLDEGLDENIE